MISIPTSIRTDIQGYLNPFLNYYRLLPTYYPLLVELTVLEGFLLDRREQNLSYIGIGYTVGLAILGLVLGALSISAV